MNPCWYVGLLPDISRGAFVLDFSEKADVQCLRKTGRISRLRFAPWVNAPDVYAKIFENGIFRIHCFANQNGVFSGFCLHPFAGRGLPQGGGGLILCLLGLAAQRGCFIWGVGGDWESQWGSHPPPGLPTYAALASSLPCTRAVRGVLRQPAGGRRHPTRLRPRLPPPLHRERGVSPPGEEESVRLFFSHQTLRCSL